jgi:hypothetical protein
MNAKHLLIESWPAPPTTGILLGIPRGVKVTHLPTGVFATCDTERSQHTNRDKALAEVITKVLYKNPV